VSDEPLAARRAQGVGRRGRPPGVGDFVAFYSVVCAAGPGQGLGQQAHDLSEPVWRHYNVWNHGPDGALANPGWRGGFTELSSILNDAQAMDRRVRAVGARWSLSQWAVCPDVMINTMPLNFHTVGLASDDLSSSAVDPSRIVFAQCGTTVRELSETLEARGLSLPTSGASNGQTICGAISTGTHGSARRVGSMQDFMLGLHVLAEDGKQYWIERASAPVVSSAFCQRLGATLVRDDLLFRAAVVGLGSFGVIHAVMFEAAPGFLLEVHRRRLDWPQVAHAAVTLELDGLGLPHADEEPFHLDIAVNPYSPKRGQGGAIVTAMYKRALRPVPPRAARDTAMLPGVDLLAVSGTFANLAPPTIKHGVNAMFVKMMKATERPPLGTHGQVFPTTALIGRSLSTEIGVALEDADQALGRLIDVANQSPFPGLFGVRYVQRSDALLAFTKFATTCTIEMTGAGCRKTEDFYTRAWAALDKARIPYTQHWGKINDTTASNLRTRWGSSVDEWIAARQSLLSPVGRRLFSNDLLSRCELHA
jgi:hypothetical protein